MVRRAIESLYKGICTITNSQEVFDPITKRTTFKDVVICENEPCRLSHSSTPNADQTETTANVIRIVKIFIAPELEIKAGSKIVVTQNNVTRAYKASSIQAVYTNHQEINLIDETEC